MVLQVIGQPLLVEADRQRIEQVIINLVNNAVKYSPNANSVYIDLIREDSQVTVKIKDTGIGLEVEQQNKIFSKFYRANGNVNIPGLGLGLFLSREIIKQHHGTISVKSEMGKGSEFFFIIPVKKQNKKDYVIKSS
jgi:signal transduction histidine kinase